MALLQPFCPSPKVKVQEGLVRQDRWLLGTGCTTTHQNKPLLPYFQCTRPPFPSLCTGSAPFEDKTLFPAPRSPSSPLGSRAEQHPACPKSPAYCHSPFSPALFLLTRFAFFFFIQAKSPSCHLRGTLNSGAAQALQGRSQAVAGQWPHQCLLISWLTHPYHRHTVKMI